MKKIYLACPYTDSDFNVSIKRFDIVNKVAGELMNEGYIVLSPISHTHPIACVCDLPKDWEFWERQDREFIRWADEVFVLRLDGWLDSIGVRAEINFAIKMKKPVRYLDWDGSNFSYK